MSISHDPTRRRRQAPAMSALAPLAALLFSAPSFGQAPAASPEEKGMMKAMQAFTGVQPLSPEIQQLQDSIEGSWGEDPFFKNAKAGTMIRSSYFYRSQPNDVGPAAEAWGIGGWLYGETGELFKLLSFGGAYYYVIPASAPNDGSFNYILKDPDQKGYSVLGEVYARLRYSDQVLTVGRQALNFNWSLDGILRTYNRFDGTFIGRRDVRAMLPLDFESAVVQGKLYDDTVRYYGGFAWEMRQVNQDEFKNLAQGALLPGDSSGMSFGGAQWKISKDMMLQGSYHSVENLLNMGWVDFDYVYRLPSVQGGYLRFDNEYIRQSSTGQEYLGHFDTWNWAGYVEARYWPWVVPYFTVGVNGQNSEIRSPYSLGPSYLVQRIGENAKAGERTWIMGTTFDFTTLRAKGLFFDLTYGQRTNRHVNGNSGQPLADWDELAADLIYTFQKENGWLNGVRMRTRWAKVWQSGNNFSGGTITDINTKQTDVRFDIQYVLPFW